MPDRRMLAAGIVLLVAGAITVGLAARLVQRTRAHRRAAEAALHDIAGFAAGTFSARATTRLLDAALTILGPAAAASAAGRVVPPSLMALGADDAIACRCVPLLGPTYFFRLDTRDTSLLGVGTAIGPSETAAIRGLVSFSYRAGAPYALIAAGGRPIFFIARRSPGGRGAIVYGFAASAESLRANVFEPALRAGPLLPGSAAGAAPPESLATLAVLVGPDRVALFETRPDYGSALVRVLDSETAATTFHVRASLNPQWAGSLVAGGLPPASTAQTVAAAGAAFAMLAAALLLLKRSARLARAHLDFTSTVTHELRTPLTQIMLYAETLQLGRTRSGDEAARAAEAVVREARRLARMVDNALQFTRRGSPQVPVRRACSLAAIAADVIAGYKIQAGYQNVRIDLLPAGFGDRAPVDPDAVQQVLTNLIDNALRYGPDWQRIVVGVEPRTAEIELWVEDQGPGIAPEERDRVWLPFVQGSGANGAGGAGIGLAVVRRLVREHGGRVHIAAARGGGARVAVTFPTAAP